MSWTVRDTTRRLGFCSTMFRVVGISSVLDSPEVDDDMRDYVVYHECLHLRQRYSGNSRHHDSRFRSWERAYPEWKGIEARLGRLHQQRAAGKGRRRARRHIRSDLAWKSRSSLSHLHRTGRLPE
jgi:predicted metal-dependent hydrolase